MLRGPDAFAQFRLQRDVQLHVIADGNVLVASCGWARRNVLIAGQRVSVRYGQALRVHQGYRRQGLGDAVRLFSRAMNTALPSMAQYDIMRSGNFAVVGWWNKHVPGFFDGTPQREGEVPGIPVAVAQIPAAAAARASASVRPARPEDLPACVELLNRTHGGARPVPALHRRVSRGPPRRGLLGRARALVPLGVRLARLLRARVGAAGCAPARGSGTAAATCASGSAGRRPARRTPSRARRCSTGASPRAPRRRCSSSSPTSRARTRALGRDFLLLSVDQQPELAKRLEPLEPATETRYLRWDLRQPPITRPYTDLRYW